MDAVIFLCLFFFRFLFIFLKLNWIADAGFWSWGGGWVVFGGWGWGGGGGGILSLYIFKYNIQHVIQIRIFYITILYILSPLFNIVIEKVMFEIILGVGGGAVPPLYSHL